MPIILKRALWVSLILAALLTTGCSSSDDDDSSDNGIVTGKAAGSWDVYYTDAETGGISGPEFWVIEQSGKGLDLRAYPKDRLPGDGSGSIEENDISLELDRDSLYLSGVLVEDETRISGTWTGADSSGTWEALKRDDDASPIVLINLGDSLTNGVQNFTLNELTQVNGYTQVLAEQMAETQRLLWSNPLLTPALERKSPETLPFNLGVSGATLQSLIYEQSGGDNLLNDLMFAPLPQITGAPLSQLEAAEYLAAVYPDFQKVFTLWIGSNDVMGALLAGSGSLLTADAFNAFLSDTEGGHDLESMMTNFALVVQRLRAIPDSRLFIANLPNLEETGYMFKAEDIERMALFDAEITVMPEGMSIGFGPFFNPEQPEMSIARGLATDNITLNAMIAALINSGDNYSMTAEETVILSTRIQAINNYISLLADADENVHLVDTNAVFTSVCKETLSLGGETVLRGFGGGTFSLDGFHLSNTAYALIANAFIDAMNAAGVGSGIEKADAEALWQTDPYHDKDGDGYAPGPEDAAAVDAMLIPLMDCDDTNPLIVAPYIVGDASCE